MKNPGNNRLFCGERARVGMAWFLGAALCVGLLSSARAEEEEGGPDFSSEPFPEQTAGFPDRPSPMLELGEPFLAPFPLGNGVVLPTGATWRPSLQVFGDYRTAVQTFKNGAGRRTSEWANRLDIYSNLQLTGTERLIVGLRPFDNQRDFSGYEFGPSGRWVDSLNPRLQTAFFEGNFGEIFPNLDPSDSKQLDYEFSVGRQLLTLQQGMLLNGTMDMVGVTRDNLSIPGGSHLRWTSFFAWNKVQRAEGEFGDHRAKVVGIHTLADFFSTTFELDTVYLDSSTDRGSGFYSGLSATQRFGALNTTFRALTSVATDRTTPLIRNGTVLFGQVSWTPTATENLLYWNAFWGLDHFNSVARDPDQFGPAGNTGILFSEVGIGRYGAALESAVDRRVGSAMGYQMFLDGQRRQLILEIGGRAANGDRQISAGAAGLRFQQAIGQNAIWQIDGFAGGDDAGAFINGVRTEIQVKF